MSSEVEKVKNFEKVEKITTKKEDNPKRVEAGKRLAAISKASKERKMRDKIEAEKKASDGDFSINYALLFGAIVTAVAIASLYYTRKDNERETIKHVVVKEEPKPETKKNRLYYL